MSDVIDQIFKHQRILAAAILDLSLLETDSLDRPLSNDIRAIIDVDLSTKRCSICRNHIFHDEESCSVKEYEIMHYTCFEKS